MVIEIIYVHKVCKSQLVRAGNQPLFCEGSDHMVSTAEVMEVDNTPSPSQTKSTRNAFFSTC